MKTVGIFGARPKTTRRRDQIRKFASRQITAYIIT